MNIQELLNSNKNYYLTKKNNIGELTPLIINNHKSLHNIFPLQNWDIISECKKDNKNIICNININFQIILITATTINDTATSFKVYQFFKEHFPTLKIDLYKINSDKIIEAELMAWHSLNIKLNDEQNKNWTSEQQKTYSELDSKFISSNNKLTLEKYISNDKYEEKQNFGFIEELKTKVIIFGHCSTGNNWIENDSGKQFSIILLIKTLIYHFKDVMKKDKYFKIFFHNCFSETGICNAFNNDINLKELIIEKQIELIIYCSTSIMPRYIGWVENYFKNNFVEGIHYDKMGKYGNLVKKKITINNDDQEKKIIEIETMNEWKNEIKTLEQFYLTDFLNNK